MKGFGTSRFDVVYWLSQLPAGWHAAEDLQATRDGNFGIRASIQSISNALRHAESYGYVRRTYPTKRRAEWRLTMRGMDVANHFRAVRDPSEGRA